MTGSCYQSKGDNPNLAVTNVAKAPEIKVMLLVARVCFRMSYAILDAVRSGRCQAPEFLGCHNI